MPVIADVSIVLSPIATLSAVILPAEYEGVSYVVNASDALHQLVHFSLPTKLN